jgi:7-cyano-7-deazaguanine synthase in queuosine biosynthesis
VRADFGVACAPPRTFQTIRQKADTTVTGEASHARKSATPISKELAKIIIVSDMREMELSKTYNYIHLISGGLDSAYSLLQIAKEKKQREPSVVIHPIYFDYGHFAAETEWARVEKTIAYIRNLLNDQSIIDVPVKISLKSELFKWSKSDAFKGIEGERDPEIENRNLVLFSVLVSYLMACAKHQNIPKAEFSISSGFKEKEMPDSSSDFFRKYEDLLSMHKHKMSFHFQILKNWSRRRIVEETKALLNSDEKRARDELKKFLKLTTSCYSPMDDGEPCGACSKCESLEPR